MVLQASGAMCTPKLGYDSPGTLSPADSVFTPTTATGLNDGDPNDNQTPGTTPFLPSSTSTRGDEFKRLAEVERKGLEDTPSRSSGAAQGNGQDVKLQVHHVNIVNNTPDSSSLRTAQSSRKVTVVDENESLVVMPYSPSLKEHYSNLRSPTCYLRSRLNTPSSLGGSRRLPSRHGDDNTKSGWLSINPNVVCAPLNHAASLPYNHTGLHSSGSGTKPGSSDLQNSFPSLYNNNNTTSHDQTITTTTTPTKPLLSAAPAATTSTTTTTTTTATATTTMSSPASVGEAASSLGDQTATQGQFPGSHPGVIGNGRPSGGAGTSRLAQNVSSAAGVGSSVDQADEDDGRAPATLAELCLGSVPEEPAWRRAAASNARSVWPTGFVTSSLASSLFSGAGVAVSPVAAPGLSSFVAGRSSASSVVGVLPSSSLVGGVFPSPSLSAGRGSSSVRRLPSPPSHQSAFLPPPTSSSFGSGPAPSSVGPSISLIGRSLVPTAPSFVPAGLSSSSAAPSFSAAGRPNPSAAPFYPSAAAPPPFQGTATIQAGPISLYQGHANLPAGPQNFMAAPTGPIVPLNTNSQLVERATFFRPMECRTHRRITEMEAHDLMIKGFSPNYKGNPDLDRNRSAQIPEDQNCSLFLVGLPPNLTTKSLLAGIKNVGRVYATHINPPEPEKGHDMSAAKLIFFERADAERFFAIANATYGGFTLPGYPHHRARVTWNRIRSAEVDTAGTKSRVLLISGPPEIVNEDFLQRYFDQKLIYQLDQIIHHGLSQDGARALIEFRFGSYRCQSEAARMAIVREFREFGVLCEFGRDPCGRSYREEPLCVPPFPDPAVPPSAGHSRRSSDSISRWFDP